MAIILSSPMITPNTEDMMITKRLIVSGVIFGSSMILFTQTHMEMVKLCFLRTEVQIVFSGS